MIGGHFVLKTYIIGGPVADETRTTPFPMIFGRKSSMGAISHEGITLYEWTGSALGNIP
jgi:hypothetical protein